MKAHRNSPAVTTRAATERIVLLLRGKVEPSWVDTWTQASIPRMPVRPKDIMLRSWFPLGMGKISCEKPLLKHTRAGP